MPKVSEHKPTSLTEFVQLVEKLQDASQHSLWYRGCGGANYELLPSLYRHPDQNSVQDRAKLEQDLMTRFQQRSVPMQPRPFTGDWDVLFFMQHYRIPTRLLDWSENPFVGLYFAVMSAHFELTATGKQKFEDAAAVWIMNPVLWNRHALNHQSYDGGVLSQGDEALKGYQPQLNFEGMNRAPVALYGVHNSPRIVAQRGVFTIFGQNTTAMETVFNTDSFPRDSLHKVVLSRRYLPSLRKAVLNHGVTESSIFPDLEGLAQEIRRSFGFKD